MSKGRVKLLLVVGGAVVAGSFALFRKLVPIRGEDCHYCQAKDVYELKGGGRVWAKSCIVCGARYVTAPSGQVERIDDDKWASLVEQAHAAGD